MSKIDAFPSYNKLNSPNKQEFDRLRKLEPQDIIDSILIEASIILYRNKVRKELEYHLKGECYHNFIPYGEYYVTKVSPRNYITYSYQVRHSRCAMCGKEN